MAGMLSDRLIDRPIAKRVMRRLSGARGRVSQAPASSWHVSCSRRLPAFAALQASPREEYDKGTDGDEGDAGTRSEPGR